MRASFFLPFFKKRNKKAGPREKWCEIYFIYFARRSTPTADRRHSLQTHFVIHVLMCGSKVLSVKAVDPANKRSSPLSWMQHTSHSRCKHTCNNAVVLPFIYFHQYNFEIFIDHIMVLILFNFHLGARNLWGSQTELIVRTIPVNIWLVYFFIWWWLWK